MKKIRLDIYIAGSMEGRTNVAVRKERRHIRGLLSDIFSGSRFDVHIRDPVLKERHLRGRTITMHSCNLTPRQINQMDLRDVEESHIIYWSTADIFSEGSEVEFAGGGWFNHWFKKGWFRKTPTRTKLLVMVGKRRAKKAINHFQNMWHNVHIFSTHEKAMQFLKKYYRLGGQDAIRTKRR